VLIDWFTVIAQIFNFLILVLLLRRFLYRPIINAMAEREARIADKLEEARRKRDEAAAEIEAYRQKNAEFAQEREKLVREAEAIVADRRKAWLEEARAEVNDSRSRWQKALAQEKEALLQTLRRQAGHHTFEVMRHALADLADEELEERIIKVFLARLKTLPEEEAQPIHEALRSGAADLTLNSGFELAAEQRRALRQAIIARFGAGQAIHFRTLPDLICGLELVAPNHKVAWSLASYLDELEEALLDAIAEAPIP
jgi:F-type H+-transporting ATPase subunit b